MSIEKQLRGEWMRAVTAEIEALSDEDIAVLTKFGVRPVVAWERPGFQAYNTCTALFGAAPERRLDRDYYARTIGFPVKKATWL